MLRKNDVERAGQGIGNYGTGSRDSTYKVYINIVWCPDCPEREKDRYPPGDAGWIGDPFLVCF